MKRVILAALATLSVCSTSGAYDHRQYRDYPVRRVSHPTSIIGLARVKDGDTISIDNESIRFYGMDAPEKNQTCRHKMLASMCGVQAAEVLTRFINGKIVTCIPVPGQRDPYARVVAKCSTDDVTDLGAAMVNAGYALAYRRYSMDYVISEDEARATKKGIWSSEFVFPWEWRKGVR